jgi:hypothetical protein
MCLARILEEENFGFYIFGREIVRFVSNKCSIATDVTFCW